MKKIFIVLTFVISTFIITTSALAHPGNTDSSGCHTCRTNCSSWGLSYGEYHCHKAKNIPQPLAPVTSTWGSNGTGYTTPAPQYSNSSLFSTTPSCPSNSSYDSFSGNCKCNYGYVVESNYLGKESCVSGSTYCRNKYGIFSSYDSLSKSCECNSGYIFGKDIIGNDSCVSFDSFCRDKYGYNSKYNRLADSCECNSGYEFKNGKCAFVFSHSPAITDYSFLNGLLNDKKCGTNSYLTGDGKCSCYTGYEWVDKDSEENLDCKQKVICPINSYATSDGKCSCNEGYVNKEEACVLKESTLATKKTNTEAFIESEKKLIVTADKKLSEKLKGRILLQVENNGEAWYVNPRDSKKYYMAGGQEAYEIMRNLGVGITNKDLEKIKTDKKFAKQHSGKIFLQVENNGEAYYIDSEGASHYLKDGAAAYEAMRNLGLGITNNDLRKIEISEIKK